MQRTKRQMPVVIRKNGEKFIPHFPVELMAGDQIIMVEEICGSEVPEETIWTVNGCTSAGGPVCQKRGSAG